MIQTLLNDFPQIFEESGNSKNSMEEKISGSEDVIAYTERTTE